MILLQTPRFFCVGEGCRRKVFTEQLPGTVARYARRSCRSSGAINWLTLALGGRPACRLGLLAGRSTLLRGLHQRAATAVVAEGSGAQVYAVAYKLAPVFQWPQIQEGEAVVRWISAQRNVDAGRTALGGDLAGGKKTCIAQRLRDETARS